MSIETKRITAAEYNDMLSKGVIVNRIHHAQYTTAHRAHDVNVGGENYGTVVFVPDDASDEKDDGYLMIFDRIGFVGE